jgi:hypothetical protein
MACRIEGGLEASESLADRPLAGAHPGGGPGVLRRHRAMLVDEPADGLERLGIAG